MPFFRQVSGDNKGGYVDERTEKTKKGGYKRRVCRADRFGRKSNNTEPVLPPILSTQLGNIL